MSGRKPVREGSVRSTLGTGFGTGFGTEFGTDRPDTHRRARAPWAGGEVGA